MDEFLSTKYPTLIPFLKEEAHWTVPSVIAIVAIVVAILLANTTSILAWILAAVTFFLLSSIILIRYQDYRHDPLDTTDSEPNSTQEHPKVKQSSKGAASPFFAKIMVLAAGCAVICFFALLQNGLPSLPPPETTPPTVTAAPVEPEILGWEKIKNAEPGETIYFGKYRQLGWTDDKEHISWLVLAKESDKLLILTTKCIDCQQFHDEEEACTWETSYIRRWLNHDFFEAAFNDYEKSKILTTSVPPDENPKYDTVFLGSSTDDKIFLLSIIEAKKYLGSNEKLKSFPTDYAKSVGSGFDKELEGNPGWWWLRIPGQNNLHVADVRSGGAINQEGYPATAETFSIRPALWLDIKD